MVLVKYISNYRKKPTFRNIISINSSKIKIKLTILIFSHKNKFLPLPSFDRCGQSSGRNPIPQVAGKTTPQALQFDPNNFQF